MILRREGENSKSSNGVCFHCENIEREDEMSGLNQLEFLFIISERYKYLKHMYNSRKRL